MSPRHETALTVRSTIEADYTAIRRRLVAALVASGAGAVDADELAHDAIAQTYFGAHRLRNPDAVVAYGRTTAKRAHWRARRDLRRTVPMSHDELPDHPTGSTAEDPMDRQASLQVLAAALTELSHRDRQMLWERHVDGWSCEEIGARHGLSPTSVPTVLLRARRRAKRLLEQHDPVEA